MTPSVPVNPSGLGKPLGYSHGVRAAGFVFVAGQIGADPLPNGRHRVVSRDFAAQFEKALRNVLEVVNEARLRPENIVEMTIFVKDMRAYRAARPRLGDAWKNTMGRHYPAMTLVGVSDLFEEDAVVEIRAIATEAP